MLVPAMQSMGTCISSSTLSTPTCAPPLAPPPASTSPMRGRLFAGAAWSARDGDGAATKIAVARASAPRAREGNAESLGIMAFNLIF